MAAKEINCIVTGYDHRGSRCITQVGGQGWRLSVEEATRAIQTGGIFFVTFEGQSYIVTVGRGGDGRPELHTSLDDGASMLLRLKECAGD